MWPVIVRELRSASRGPATYWLRPLGAGAACAAALLAMHLNPEATTQGKKVFAALHLTTFCAIWLLVPLVAADSLSRERREGTLGLLFLTPLRPFHIAVAKTLAQSVRAFTLWLATVPVVVLPMLMGGVSRVEVILSLLINSASFCWALAAGIWVSSRSTQFHRTIIAASIVAFVFFIVYLLLNFALGILVFSASNRFDLPEALMGAVVALGNHRESWDLLMNLPQFPTWQWTLAGLVGVSALLLGVFTWLAARVLRSTWQVSGSPGRWARWRDRFCTPVVFKSLYRRWIQWSLASNPVGWLERRTWSSRIGKWAWLAILCALYPFVLADHSFLWHDFTEVQVLLAAGLMASTAFSAAASFRRERDNGVLALLLVSPLGVKQIIGGRLRALWSQYLPATGLLFGAWLYLHKTFGNAGDPFWIAFFATSFLSIPVIGLYCSLWRQTFFGALLGTVLLVGVLPLALSLLVAPIALGSPLFDFDAPGKRPFVLVFSAMIQLIVAGMTLGLLFRKLGQRSFTLPAV